MEEATRTRSMRASVRLLKPEDEKRSEMKGEIIAGIREELKRGVNGNTRMDFQRFFREEVLCYGVKTAEVRKISRRSFVKLKGRSKQEIFLLCEELFASDYCEEAFIASDWTYRLRDRFEPGDLALFEGWIGRYINNWAKCDTFCNHTLGAFVERFPASLQNLKSWAGSKNRWFRRAASVTLILPARKGRFLSEILEIADLLIGDQDDLVQKGCGWMLKEASRTHTREVFEFVMTRKKEMPRTMLRYAIEKMPAELKKLAMEREKS